MSLDKEIENMSFNDLNSYDNTRPYDYIDSLVSKYKYTSKGIEVYDVVHDFFNSNYKECNSKARQYLVMRDFTYSIVSWFYEVNDVFLNTISILQYRLYCDFFYK